MSAIAIVGMACRCAVAHNPHAPWENVLPRRRSIHGTPPERLRLEDYLSADPGASGPLYAAPAALIEGYKFARVRFRVAGPPFRSVDMAHGQENAGPRLARTGAGSISPDKQSWLKPK